jgi:hypothetical protein
MPPRIEAANKTARKIKNERIREERNQGRE